MQNNFPPNFPQEYQLGFVEFLGKKFIVNQDVLIPRLETEVLIKRVRNFLKDKKSPKIVVDIGCGSGIIGTSIADIADEIFFIDISDKALDIARKNFYLNFKNIWNKKIHFLLSDLLTNFDFDKKNNICFVANLPYIKNNDWINMSEDTVFEPKIALFGWEKTWFELYEKLFDDINRRGFSWNIFAEFGFDQLQVAQNFLQKFSNWKTDFFDDYAGILRFVEIEI